MTDRIFDHDGNQDDPLIVVPCLNEIDHIDGLLRQLEAQIATLGGRVVVVDGGSSDGTRDVVATFTARNPQITLLDNPDRIQSAAINLAVARYGDMATHLIRIDAHCTYPDDFCEVLMRQARSVYANSICVSMIAEGAALFQQINAETQNSPVGNGGSSHRSLSGGAYVDHGHHALIKLDAFRAVGGYDPSFSHNEDAEFDYRLRKAGYRIWLTGQTCVSYHPRKSFRAVARQYFNYGAGRARNLVKHSAMPRLRQSKVMMVFPAVLLALFTPLHVAFAIPALLWVAYCLVMGARIAWQRKRPTLLLCGVAAMIMHLAWSIGFWQRVLRSGFVAGQRVGA